MASNFFCRSAVCNTGRIALHRAVFSSKMVSSSFFHSPCVLLHPHFSIRIFSCICHPPSAIHHFCRYPSNPSLPTSKRGAALRVACLCVTALNFACTHGIVQRSSYKIQNGGRVLSGNGTVIFRVFWYNITFMLRIVRRYVNKTCEAPSFCRYEHSFPVRSSLKWEETQFNGVEVNLSQLEDNPNLDEFSSRLKGKFTFCKEQGLK